MSNPVTGPPARPWGRAFRPERLLRDARTGRRLVRRMARRVRANSVRTLDPSAVSATASAREPCAICGEATAVGSVFFSDRQTLVSPDGSSVYVCVLCDARVRAGHRGRQLTEDEVRQLVENGSIIGLGWRP